MKIAFDTRNKDDTTQKVSYRKRWPALIIWPTFIITVIVFMLAMVPYKQNPAGMQSIHAVIHDIKSIFFPPRAPENPGIGGRAKMAPIPTAIDTYLLNTGEYPATLNDLVQDPGLEGWAGPYLKPNQLNDPWGRPFLYNITSDGYELISYGADGKPGGEGYDKDISNK